MRRLNIVSQISQSVSQSNQSISIINESVDRTKSINRSQSDRNERWDKQELEDRNPREEINGAAGTEFNTKCLRNMRNFVKVKEGSGAYCEET